MTSAEVGTWIVGFFGFGGAGAIAGYLAFQAFATKWLDSKFSERLEAYKHRQQRELEQLKFQINTLFDRATKLHQREFQVLPDAWALLLDAFRETLAFVSSLQTYPDLEKMKPAQFAAFVEACTLAAWEKEELKSLTSGSKQKYYQDHIFWSQCNVASNAANEYHTFLHKNGLFIEKTVKQRFQRIDQLVREAIVTRRAFQQYGGPIDWDKVEAFNKEGAPLLDELEELVQSRLWTQDSTA
jgi:hypothetical protein